MADPLIEVGPDGLPAGSPDDRDSAAAGAKRVVAISAVVPRAIGLGIAFAIYKLGNTKAYDDAASAAFNLDKKGMGAFAFFSAVVWSFTVFWVSFYPVIPKARVMLTSKAIRANMYIYKGGTPSGGCVLLDDDGDAGKYNRANRSMHHHTEWAVGAAFTAILASQVFPFPAFILVVVMGLGRALHQIRYSSSGYGAHAPGFAFFMMGYMTLEMLCLIAGVRQLMLAS